MRIRSGVAAALFFVILTLAMTYPFGAHLTTHVLSRGTDMDLAVWTIGWDVRMLTHQPWKIFDANIFFPFHNTLAYSENLIGVSFIAAPVIWLTGNVVLGMNIAALFSVAVGAFGAFLLARKLGLSIVAALIAGVIFGFAPPRFLRMDQLPISSVQWIPFALLALHTYFDTRRARYLRIAIALYALEALSSGHGAAMLTLAIGLLLIWKWMCGEPIALATRLRDVGWQGIVAILPVALIYLPYRSAQIEVGLKRELGDWASSTSSFFASPTLVHTWWHGFLPNWHWLTGEPDAWLFPGVLPLVLALCAVMPLWTSKDTRREGGAWRASLNTPDHAMFYFALFAMGIWLAAPPPIGIWPFVYWMPGLNFIRVPSRFTVVGILGLGIAAASGFDRLTRLRTHAARAMAGAAVIAVLLAEFSLGPMEIVPLENGTAAIDRWVGTQAQPMALLEMPMSDSRVDSRRERATTQFMLHSMAHWKPIFVGYSGIQPPGYKENYLTFVSFPDAASLALARRLGITHVILHGELVDPSERAEVDQKYAQFADQVQLVHAEGAGRLYAIRP